MPEEMRKECIYAATSLRPRTVWLACKVNTSPAKLLASKLLNARQALHAETREEGISAERHNHNLISHKGRWDRCGLLMILMDESLLMT